MPADGPSDRPVWLTGLMGSGKTTLGRALATATGREYLDNDLSIAAETGQTTEQLARQGGTNLHAREAAYVRAVCERTDIVAGIPASAADRPELLALLRNSGLLVYLHCPPEVLAARVSRDDPRPWLSTSPDAMEQLLTSMYAGRDAPLREAAHLTVDSEAPVDDLVKQALAAYGWPSQTISGSSLSTGGTLHRQ